MQIGRAAQASGVSAKMIRHYEAIGLLPRAPRRDSNYRDYGPGDIQRLTFIRHARDLGFPIVRIRDLLELWSNRHRASAEVKAIASAHVRDLERRIAEMQRMVEELRGLAAACEGDARPECPILSGLAGAATAGGMVGDAGIEPATPPV